MPIQSPAEKGTKYQVLSAAVSWVARLRAHLDSQEPGLHCPQCGRDIGDMQTYRDWRICGNCGHYFQVGVRTRIHMLADPQSFAELSSPRPEARRRHVFDRPIYRPQRQTESVLAGTARVDGQPLALIAFDFPIKGGTMGVVAGETIARAFELATKERLPVLAAIATGGVRIQEGLPALLQMARTTLAVQEFQSVNKPFVALLANPTTGGVYASFVSLADVILAERGATIGFAGPRVAELVLGKREQPEVRSAESALENGMIDAVVQREDLRAWISRAIALAQPVPGPVALPAVSTPEPKALIDRDKVDVLELVRRRDRPTAKDYIETLFTDFTELHGDRVTGDDPTIVGGIGRWQSIAVMIIAMQRHRNEPNERGTGPAGYHKAERLVRMASRLGIPIVTLVDTPGADLSPESERYGIAGAIAHCLAALLQASSPTISIIIGEGTSGGALAIAAADKVIIQENATYTVISPEGVSAITFRNGRHSAEAAKSLELDSRVLLSQGIIDQIIREPDGGAHVDVKMAAALVGDAIHSALVTLLAMNSSERLAARRARYGGL